MFSGKPVHYLSLPEQLPCHTRPPQTRSQCSNHTPAPTSKVQPVQQRRRGPVPRHAPPHVPVHVQLPQIGHRRQRRKRQRQLQAVASQLQHLRSAAGAVNSDV